MPILLPRWRSLTNETLRQRTDGFPPAVAGRYRLDTLLAWEDRMLAASGWDAGPTSSAPAVALPQLPAKRRPGGRFIPSAVILDLVHERPETASTPSIRSLSN